MEKTVTAARKSKSLEEPQFTTFKDGDHNSEGYGLNRGGAPSILASVHK
jgi:hypothetical protein